MGGNDTLFSPEAQLLYRLPGPTPDGRTVLLLSPLELLQRLATTLRERDCAERGVPILNPWSG
jgi:hypothetical protein